MKKAAPYILLLLMAVAIIVIKSYRDRGRDTDPGTKKPPSSTDRNRGFDRRIHFLEYTAHAKCRMECRRVSQKEVEEIMQIGKINYRKTDIKDRPCPSYALEGVTQDDQRVRIIFAQCDNKTKVVTVIDLDTDFTCNCPGDEGKYQNKN